MKSNLIELGAVDKKHVENGVQYIKLCLLLLTARYGKNNGGV